MTADHIEARLHGLLLLRGRPHVTPDGHVCAEVVQTRNAGRGTSASLCGLSLRLKRTEDGVDSWGTSVVSTCFGDP